MGLFSVVGLYSDVQDNSSFAEELNERDFDALRDYLKSQRALDIEGSTTNLTISGNVRTEWRHLNESCMGIPLRGHHATDLIGRPLSRNDFDLEFNLRFDYVTGNTWSVAQIRFDNSGGVEDNNHPCIKIGTYDPNACCKKQAGQCLGDPKGYHGSGTSNDINLKKAFFGAELYRCGDSSFYFELGRRGQIYDVFDSNIQFLSRLDGLVLKYESSFESVADWYIQAIGFLVDERVNQFAWGSEIGFFNICDSGLNLKYSIIDWEKNGRNRCSVRNPAGFRFINSQWTASYNINKACFNKNVEIYGAFLMNHAAKKMEVNNRKLYKNIGWYAGILLGKVRKEGDWSLEIQYQLVQAQAVPDDDNAGICRGNVLKESFTSCGQRGNGNYKGWRFQGLYAFTDNVTLDTIFEFSKAEEAQIGGTHDYSKFEMEAIYAF